MSTDTLQSRAPVLVVLLLTLAGMGCATSGPSLSRTAALVDMQVGDSRMECEEHIKLGPVTMSLLRTLVRLAGDEVDAEARAYLSDIKRVEVATYSFEPAVDDATTISLREVEESLSADGWTRMVRTRDPGETTMVMVNEDTKGQVRGLFVVSVDRDEMEVVRLEGKLDRALAQAMAESDSGIGEIVRKGP